jgi:hypothetical protein
MAWITSDRLLVLPVILSCSYLRQYKYASTSYTTLYHLAIAS